MELKNRYPEKEGNYIFEVELEAHLLVILDLPDLKALARGGHEIGLVAVLGQSSSTSSGMNMSLVGGYSCGKEMRFSRYLLSLSCIISIWVGGGVPRC